MSINTHIQNWIDRSELVIDYYTLFIKAWIPFNAWYMHNFYDENSRSSDSSIINHLKNSDNTYRDKIKSLLRSTSEEGEIFKSYLYKLHSELIDHPIPNYDNRITFDNIVISKNSKKIESFDKGHYSYKCEFKSNLPKTDKRFICEVLKKNDKTTIHRIELQKWCVNDLENNSNFTGIPKEEMKNNLKNCFREINPNKPTNITLDIRNLKRNNHIKINDNLYFQNDENLVSSAIIHLIYELRCKLFHGEIDPTKANEKIYEYAFHIQRTLIKELK